MTRLVRLIRVLSCSLVLLASASTRAEPLPWTLRHAFQAMRVGAVTVSPDGSQVAFAVTQARMDGDNNEWRSQVHVAARNGTSSLRLTEGAASATSPEWSPDGKSITFILNGALWRIPAGGGQAERLTQSSEGVRWHRWSPDGQRIAFLGIKPAAEKTDWVVVGQKTWTIWLRVLSLKRGADGRYPVKELLEQNAEGNSGRMQLGAHFDWSPDSRKIAVASQPLRGSEYWTTQRVMIVDVESGEKRPLRKPDNRAEMQPMFSPDGKSIAMVVSDAPATWGYTRRVHVVSADGARELRLADTPDLQPSLVGWSRDAKRLLVRESMKTSARILALPLTGTAPTVLGAAGVMVDAPRINLNRTRIGFVSQSPDTPPEVFTADAQDFKPAQQATRINGGLPKAELGKTDVISWQARDGLQIEGLVTYPAAYKHGVAAPLVVMVHGGPTDVFAQTFTGVPEVPFPVAVFAARGYVVLRPNVRGSSGYGRAFRYANDRDWGGDDFRDILAGIDKLVGEGIADHERIGIVGSSYGGYLTAWAVTQSRRFRAATVIAGITNLISNTGANDVPGFTPDNLGGDFWEARRLWLERSPISHVERVNTPTLILHGKEDPRVPVTQGQELHTALRRMQVPTQMVIYPGEGHGIGVRPTFQCDALNRTLAWIDLHVTGRQTPHEDCTASP